jgi:hypothetical protein
MKLLTWIGKEVERMTKRRAVVDKYRIEVLEGLDDTDEKWFEESERLGAAIGILNKLKDAINEGKVTP